MRYQLLPACEFFSSVKGRSRPCPQYLQRFQIKVDKWLDELPASVRGLS
jgi:hypothetical protein